jgi:hypothetical protein
MLRIFSPHSLMTEKPGADLERGEGRGTRDGMSWEGEAPAEPKMGAIGDWRLATTASEVVKPKISRLCRNSALQKNHSPLTTHHSLLAVRYSLFAAVSLAAHFYSFPASPFPAFCFAAMMAASA